MVCNDVMIDSQVVVVRCTDVGAGQVTDQLL
jgi:hypothetical protein